jgi:alpha-tubulin suppressor-like RCC1 family protein
MVGRSDVSVRKAAPGCRFGVAVIAVLVTLLALPMAADGASPGGLFAFGYNYDGELGSAINTGTFNPNPTPTLVALPGEIGPVTRIAAGGGHSLAVTSSGQLYAFGANFSGELGISTNSGTSNPNPTPTLVGLPGEIGTVTQIAAGKYHSLVVTSSGQLYAFGQNIYGELGSATNNGTPNPNPTPTLVGLPGEIGTVTQIAAGAHHSLVLTSSGQLYAFGLNGSGELGSPSNNGTANPNPTPTLVGLPGQLGTVTQIAAGDSHSLVLTSSGQLYAFGHNRYGELGNATNNATSNPNPTPALVGFPGQIGAVTEIAAGTDNSLVLTSSGQLYAFGSNAYGELGSAANSGTSNPNPTPTLVGLPGEIGVVTQIAAADGHSSIVTSSGQLYTFGRNAYGELGSTTNNGTTNPNPIPTPVTLASGTTVDTVAKGPSAGHTLAIVSGLAITTSSLATARVSVRYSAALSAAGGTAPLTWSASGLPGGLSIAAKSGVISGTPNVAGSFSVMVTVTDSYGSQASQTFTLTVAPAPLALSNVAESHRTWHESKHKPIGTTFSFTLNQQATVSFAFTQLVRGRKIKGRCLAQTHKNRHQPTCTRTVTVGTLSLTAHAGVNKLFFKGRISHSKKLSPGRYTLVIRARAAGKSSTPRKLTFTILPS